MSPLITRFTLNSIALLLLVFAVCYLTAKDSWLVFPCLPFVGLLYWKNIEYARRIDAQRRKAAVR